MLHVEGSYGVAYAASLEMSKVFIIILIPCTKKKKKNRKSDLVQCYFVGEKAETRACELQDHH